MVPDDVIIQTSRLDLKQLRLEDAEFIFELLSTPKWIRYVGDRGISSIKKAEQFLEGRIIPSYEKFGFGFYVMTLKHDGKKLGICGLVKREGLEDVDIGYALLPQHEGNGFAIEASQAILEYGFHTLILNRIVAITDPENKASIRILEKLGMIFQDLVMLPDDETELLLYSIDKTQ